MSMLCGSIGRDLSSIKTTKFKPNEIKSFYLYFKKFCNNNETLNLLQFKRTLGILGYNNDNFICERLFQLIDKENYKIVLTFLIFLDFQN